MRRLRDFYSLLSRDVVVGGIRIDSGLMLHVDCLDLRVYQMVLPQIERNDVELILARTLTPAEGVFVDVGANVGLLSLLALSTSVSAVHSFEPNSAMMSLLRKTRANNFRAARWHLYASAVGASSDRLRLYVDRSFSGTASLFVNWHASGQQDYLEVPVITLDHWCRLEGIDSLDVLKMDVEGWEYAVLAGAQDALHRFKPYVWFEHNLPVLRRMGRNPSPVLDTLQQCGYELFYDIGTLPCGRLLTRRDVDDIGDRRVNFLAVSQERVIDFTSRVLPAMQFSG